MPFLILASLYLYFDPFKIIKKHKTFSYTTTEPNRDYISTEIYSANKEKYKYNSFILGSSRSIAFNPESWLKYLDKQAVPFSFDASGESLFGIYTKLKFLESEKTDIRNVLILFCRNACFESENHTDHLGIKHPKVSGESWFKFHFAFFKAYFNLKFLMGYYSFLITGKQNILTHGIIQDKGISIDYKTNHINLDTWDNQIAEDPIKYYESRREVFYKRDGESFEPYQEIGPPTHKMLIEMKEILERNSSNYKIVLSPIYDQVKFSVKDKQILQEIFGDHLYDFTGKNFITENDTNWYEIYHFRPFIADSIMNIIYSDNSEGNKWR